VSIDEWFVECNSTIDPASITHVRRFCWLQIREPLHDLGVSTTSVEGATRVLAWWAKAEPFAAAIPHRLHLKKVLVLLCCTMVIIAGLYYEPAVMMDYTNGSSYQPVVIIILLSTTVRAKPAIKVSLVKMNSIKCSPGTII
jgi:hypothetical protein